MARNLLFPSCRYGEGASAAARARRGRGVRHRRLRGGLGALGRTAVHGVPARSEPDRRADRAGALEWSSRRGTVRGGARRGGRTTRGAGGKPRRADLDDAGRDSRALFLRDPRGTGRAHRAGDALHARRLRLPLRGLACQRRAVHRARLRGRLPEAWPPGERRHVRLLDRVGHDAHPLARGLLPLPLPFALRLDAGDPPRCSDRARADLPGPPPAAAGRPVARGARCADGSGSCSRHRALRPRTRRVDGLLRGELRIHGRGRPRGLYVVTRLVSPSGCRRPGAHPAGRGGRAGRVWHPCGSTCCRSPPCSSRSPSPTRS